RAAAWVLGLAVLLLFVTPVLGLVLGLLVVVCGLAGVVRRRGWRLDRRFGGTEHQLVIIFVARASASAAPASS
ncbi:MAG: hypothetical protein HC788_13815, partial [Sphingopyxis sp.]|nr:hypothetical protein [Sphingopyxis sp.]